MTSAPIIVRFTTAKAQRNTANLIGALRNLSANLEGVASGPDEVAARRRIRQDINRLSAAVLIGVESVVAKTAVEGARQFGIRTPKLTGQAVSGWEPSTGTPNIIEQPVIIVPDDRGPLVKTTAELARYKLGTTIFLSNGVPYIGRLEDGHSQQAPDGFINQTITAMRRFVRTNARQIIEEFTRRRR